MKFLKLLLKRDTVAPTLAMLLATAVCSVVVVARVLTAPDLLEGTRKHAYLIWNLFLAWLPFAFALLASAEWHSRARSPWRLGGFGIGWLLFAPNAPYIFTDLVHISAMFSKHYWLDLALILSCGLTGLMLWFVSLYLMQNLARERYGDAASWGFVLLAAILSSVGIHLGRFARFNSWDAVTKPGEVYQGVSAWMTSALGDKPTLAFAAFFAGFLFLAYVMLYALTHLTPVKARAQTETAR